MMLSHDAVASVVTQYGGVAHGFVPLDALESALPSEGMMAQRFARRTAGYASALIVAFSYYADRTPGNIALFARGEDYFSVMKARLEYMAGAFIPFLPMPPAVLPNGYPLPIVAAARLAGVGMTGLHGLCICPPYGSFVSLGALLWPEPVDMGRDAGPCAQCGACVTACPTGALQWAIDLCEIDEQTKTRRFMRERCLSHLTQKEGTLTPEEETLLGRASCIWGCDICQEVCPHNSAPEKTKLPEFLSDLTPFVDPETIDMTTPLKRHYARRGSGILQRNARLQGS